MAYFLDQFINGLTLGAVYGLIAIGYTMVYGIIGMINFAHGELFMIGAFISLIVLLLLAQFGIASVPIAILVTLILTAVFTALWGYVIERIAYRPLRGAMRLAPLISAIGMSILLQSFVQLVQGAGQKSLAPLITGHIVLGDLDGVHVQVAIVRIVIIAVTIILMTAFSLMVARTSLGRAQRACEQDRKMAQLLGINVDRVISLTFVSGAALAAVAGLLYTVYYGSIDFFIGFLAGLKAFTAAVLGGIGSLPGAMLGGILIGLIEVFWAGYANAEYKDVAVFAILVLVLLFRPTGLLGRAVVEKV